jgi:hypothetical protein
MDFIIEKLGLALAGDNTDLSFVDESEPKSDNSEGEESEDESKESEDNSEEESKSESDEDSSEESKESEEESKSESDEDSSEDETEDESKGESEEDSSEDETEGESEEDSSEEDSSEGDCDETEDSGDESEDESEGEGSELDLDKLLEELESEDKGGLLSSNEALSQGFKDQNTTTLMEQDWRPWSTTGDRVEVVPSYGKDTKRIERVEKALKPVVAAIKASFRNRFLQSRQPVIRHGVRRGEELSERVLVDTFIEVKSGKAPSRPWQRVEPANAESLAIAVVGDQSGSMSGKLARHAALGMLAIASAFDSLGSPILCVGVESFYCPNGYESRPAEVISQEGNWSELHSSFHRTGSVRYNIFKGWDERLRGCSGRFLNYDTSGSTPLEDGIQFALSELTKRKERHRIVLVITDGMPDNPKVVRRQIRLAKEAGVHVVGVGIGDGLWQVVELFPDHVMAYNLEELPKVLLKTVEGLVFPSQSKKAKISCGVK